MNPDSHQETLSSMHSLLSTEFLPDLLEIANDSERHKNHREARNNPNKGHFLLKIRSVAFRGKTRVQQHRMIYTCLSPIMDRIHALNILIL